MQCRFNQLSIGQKFILKGTTYTKVKPVRKSCCTTLYNAISDSGKKLNVNLMQIVEKI